jgi:hypothetical protein
MPLNGARLDTVHGRTVACAHWWHLISLRLALSFWSRLRGGACTTKKCSSERATPNKSERTDGGGWTTGRSGAAHLACPAEWESSRRASCSAPAVRACMYVDRYICMHVTGKICDGLEGTCTRTVACARVCGYVCGSTRIGSPPHTRAHARARAHTHTHTHAHTHTHTRTHTHTHTNTHARAHARARARTHTHAHTDA